MSSKREERFSKLKEAEDTQDIQENHKDPTESEDVTVAIHLTRDDLKLLVPRLISFGSADGPGEPRHSFLISLPLQQAFQTHHHPTTEMD